MKDIILEAIGFLLSTSHIGINEKNFENPNGRILICPCGGNLFKFVDS